jgi:hypothetical protein
MRRLRGCLRWCIIGGAPLSVTLGVAGRFRMNRTLLIFIMGLLSFLFGCSKAHPPESKKNPADAGRDLRMMMLTTPPEKTGDKPTKEFPRIYGVLMDWPIGEQTATVFSTSTGAASLYTTSSFGIIGGEGHESVRNAAMSFVRAADRFFDGSAPTTEYPYPIGDHVRFYFLTFSGVRVIDADLASINSRTSKYAELFGLGQAVLTELRLITDKRQ